MRRIFVVAQVRGESLDYIYRTCSQIPKTSLGVCVCTGAHWSIVNQSVRSRKPSQFCALVQNRKKEMSDRTKNKKQSLVLWAGLEGDRAETTVRAWGQQQTAGLKIAASFSPAQDELKKCCWVLCVCSAWIILIIKRNVLKRSPLMVLSCSSPSRLLRTDLLEPAEHFLLFN